MSRTCLAAKFVSVTLVALLFSNAWCAAQERQGGGRRPRGGFGAGGIGGGILGQAMLLRAEPVQKELNLTDDQQSQISKALQAAREQMREAFSGLRGLSQDERRKKFAELRPKADEVTQETQKKLDGILDADQQKRLDQIVLQTRGSRALADPKIAEKLELNDDQKQTIRDTFAAQRDMQRELFSGIRELSREERRKKFEEVRTKSEELRTETEKAVMDVLTDAQKEQWKQMRGAEFELDRRALFGGFGRGRGGEGRPGRRRGDGN